VTVAAFGPLTNVAELLRTSPSVAGKIARLLVVGGEHADFNLRHDPVATGVVFASGVPIDVYGADRLAATSLTSAQVQRLANSARPAAQLVAWLAVGQAARLGGRHLLGDAGAVAALVVEPPDDVPKWVVQTLTSDADGALLGRLPVAAS
jgi:inosine-uridine nucleoside N-ribohydrolase